MTMRKKKEKGQLEIGERRRKDSKKEEYRDHAREPAEKEKLPVHHIIELVGLSRWAMMNHRGRST